MLLVQYLDHPEIRRCNGVVRESGNNDVAADDGNGNSSSSSSSSTSSSSSSSSSDQKPPATSYHLPGIAGHTYYGPGGHYYGACLCSPQGCVISNKMHKIKDITQEDFFHPELPCGGEFFFHLFCFPIFLSSHFLITSF